jgi:crossover junction endodeoxyribonuclease RuvC
MKKSSQPSTAENSRTVLGIDPGTLVTGYGIVSRQGGTLRAVVYGTIRNGSGTPMPERLLAIYEELQRLIRAHRPDEAAVETAFYGKNAQSALKLGHARGVALLCAIQAGLPAAEYAPRAVKLAVTGHGNASKEQVRYMVGALLDLPATKLPLDASDALAVALSHLQRSHVARKRHSGWESFVRAHPERIRP